MGKIKTVSYRADVSRSILTDCVIKVDTTKFRYNLFDKIIAAVTRTRAQISNGQF